MLKVSLIVMFFISVILYWRRYRYGFSYRIWKVKFPIPEWVWRLLVPKLVCCELNGVLINALRKDYRHAKKSGQFKGVKKSGTPLVFVKPAICFVFTSVANADFLVKEKEYLWYFHSKAPSFREWEFAVERVDDMYVPFSASHLYEEDHKSFPRSKFDDWERYLYSNGNQKFA